MLKTINNLYEVNIDFVEKGLVPFSSVMACITACV